MLIKEMLIVILYSIIIYNIKQWTSLAVVVLIFSAPIYLQVSNKKASLCNKENI